MKLRPSDAITDFDDVADVLITTSSTLVQVEAERVLTEILRIK